MTICPTCGHNTLPGDDEAVPRRQVRLTDLQRLALKKCRDDWQWLTDGRQRVALRALHERAPELVECKRDAAGAELFRATAEGRTRVFTL